VPLEHEHRFSRAQPHRAHTGGVPLSPQLGEAEKAGVESRGPLGIGHAQGEMVERGPDRHVQPVGHVYFT
jgi:hypothetical protein